MDIPSSVSSSSWFKSGMSPKGLVGLKIVQRTALSCSEAIVLVSRLKIQANIFKSTTNHFICRRGVFIPNVFQTSTVANQSRGWRQDFEIMRTCISLTLLKCRAQRQRAVHTHIPVYIYTYYNHSVGGERCERCERSENKLPDWLKRQKTTQGST